jgi:hypothetical protein
MDWLVSVRVPSLLTVGAVTTRLPFKSVVTVLTTDCPAPKAATNARTQYFTIPG